MKDRIIDILNSETFTTSDEAGNSYVVIEQEDFESIAERIMQLYMEVNSIMGDVDVCLSDDELNVIKQSLSEYFTYGPPREPSFNEQLQSVTVKINNCVELIDAMSGLSEEESTERGRLLELQSIKTRWFSQDEFDRLNELSNKISKQE